MCDDPTRVRVLLASSTSHVSDHCASTRPWSQSRLIHNATSVRFTITITVHVQLSVTRGWGREGWSETIFTWAEPGRRRAAVRTGLLDTSSAQLERTAPREKRFCYTDKIICEHRDSKNIFVTTTKCLVRSTKRLVAAAKFLVAATKNLFVVPIFFCRTKTIFFSVMSNLRAWLR